MFSIKGLYTFIVAACLLSVAPARVVHATEGASTSTVHVRVIYRFQEGKNVSPAFMSSSGDFYGYQWERASFRRGLLYRVTHDGAFSVLHQFTGPDGDGVPYRTSEFAEGADAAIYGIVKVAEGHIDGRQGIFRQTAAGLYSIIYLFPSGYSTEDFVVHLRGREGVTYLLTETGVRNDGRGKVGDASQRSVFFVERNSPSPVTPRGDAWIDTPDHQHTVQSALQSELHIAQGNCLASPAIKVPGNVLYGLSQCDGPGGRRCLVYRENEGRVVSVAYEFAREGDYCEVGGTLSLGPDGQLYGTMNYYSKGRAILFKIER